jgi:very-short-patch-repair endonuclease
VPFPRKWHLWTADLRGGRIGEACRVTATRQLLPGVFVGSHAIAQGFLTRGQLRRRGYRRVVQGVYVDPGLPFDHQLKSQGVALLLPDGAIIGGHSAAAWYGAPFAAAHDPVTVLRTSDLTWDGPRGVRVHETDLRPGDRTVIDGLPLSTPLRTAWDVATLEPLATAVAALDAMVRAEAVDLPALRVMADTSAGRFRATRVRRAVPLVDPRAESAPESWVRVALVMAGLTPVPQYEVRVDGIVSRFDFAWPEAKVALEYEGAYHFEEGQIVRDDERVRRLRAAGWVVIRISAADLRNLDAVVLEVRTALAAR